MKKVLQFLMGIILVADILQASGEINLNKLGETESTKLAAANNDFSFKLLRQLAAEQRGASVFISPYGVATTLQMAGTGAAGRTRGEMLQVLGIREFSPDTLTAADKVAAELFHPAESNLILNAANALWYRQGTAIKPGFTNGIQKYFSATVKAVDFSHPAAAEAEINQWASDKTQGRIQGIANGMVDPVYSDLILANATYFKGRWLDPFEVRLTRERLFHPAVGSSGNIPMMEMSKKFTYRKDSGYQAVRLPYLGGNLAMYVFLPDAGSSPEKLLQILNGDKWRRVTLPGFAEREGKVVLPKFKLEFTAELNPSLKALGMKTAFDPKQADFSGVFDGPHFISEIRHKAFVEVNEQGTEAAAVTTMALSLAEDEVNPPPPFEMIVDRPFLFAIVDDRSELILFLGLVNAL